MHQSELRPQEPVPLAHPVEAINPDLIRQMGERGSFHLNYRRLLRTYRSPEVRHPIWSLNPKTEGYRFAQSHGIAVPETYGDFSHVSEISWTELPDAFVLKTTNGATAHGVVPLIRYSEGKFLDLLNVKRGPVTTEDIIRYLDQLVVTNKASADLSVEEMLFSPHEQGSEAIAPDVKLYCFYGEVGMIFCRHTNGSRNHHKFSFRYFDAGGNDLGDALVGHGHVDPELPAPLHLAELVRVSERMSVALKVPFVRLDFYEKKDSIVFGEITPAPGGTQLPRLDVDTYLGAIWDRAEHRLTGDTCGSGVFDPQYGPDILDQG